MTDVFLHEFRVFDIRKNRQRPESRNLVGKRSEVNWFHVARFSSKRSNAHASEGLLECFLSCVVDSSVIHDPHMKVCLLAPFLACEVMTIRRYFWTKVLLRMLQVRGCTVSFTLPLTCLQDASIFRCLVDSILWCLVESILWCLVWRMLVSSDRYQNYFVSRKIHGIARKVLSCLLIQSEARLVLLCKTEKVPSHASEFLYFFLIRIHIPKRER